MQIIDFKKIDESRRILKLGESATLTEIKKSYRWMVKMHHPDKCSDKDMKESEKQIREINKAYEILMDYCQSYRYPFTKKEVEDSYSKYMKGFSEDWMWGPGKEKDKQEGGKEGDYKGI